VMQAKYSGAGRVGRVNRELHRTQHTVPTTHTNTHSHANQASHSWNDSPASKATQDSSPAGLQEAKHALLEALLDTDRGSKATQYQRGLIEERQVAVEQYQGLEDLDYERLNGLWQLQYTTALDVLPILAANAFFKSPLPGVLPDAFQVGPIYQRFAAPVNGHGKVDNIIQVGTPLLDGPQGLTLTVKASYEVKSGHRLLLTFDAANVGDVRISEGLEAFLAPAMLPRTSIQQAALLALKQFKLSVPFRNASQMAGRGGGSYQMTFLDQDLMIGRPSDLGGTFVLTKVKA